MLQMQHKNTGKGPLWLVDNKYIIGCDDASNIKVPKTTATERFAELLVNGDDIELVNISDDEAPKVNGVPVRGKKKLVAGDLITICDEEFVILDPKQIKRQAAAAADAPEKVEKAQWAFKALNTALADKQFPLQKSQTIGRASECEISLGVVHLSRKHAKITVTDSGLLIEDLESSNGTFINAEKVSRATAVAGDEVSFDTLRFRVIGPKLDSSKTHVRASSDNDLTTIRPALNLADHGLDEKGRRATVQQGAKAAATNSVDTPRSPNQAKPMQSGAYVPEADKQTTKTLEVDQAAKKTSSGGVLLFVLLIAIGGIGAWFFFGRS